MTQLELGQRAERRRRFNTTDAETLRQITGAATPAGAVPEALINALFSDLLGVDLPGRGTNYLKQETEFLAAVPLDQDIIAEIEIIRLRPDKHLVDLSTTCRLANGTPLASGRALVLAKDVDGAWG
ncbi:phosphate acetyltransferase [Maricaulis sp.]|uniref:phosphate acetyltransferase n=1 Tax=Maricaulis sp. TaxID=1486257 RepID=UPI00261653F3|nr:phosphate acetyltransferase [Maricaulis sp.]